MIVARVLCSFGPTGKNSNRCIVDFCGALDGCEKSRKALGNVRVDLSGWVRSIRFPSMLPVVRLGFRCPNSGNLWSFGCAC